MILAPELSSTKMISKTAPCIYQQADDSTLQEDDTCYLLSIEMPGVNGKDISVSLQNNSIIIGGYRRIVSSTDGRILKRQRLRRRFDIDPNVIDVNRAVANLWNGSLTLYAPKKVSDLNDPAFSLDDF